MTQQYRILSVLITGFISLVSTHGLKATVADVTGDVGSAQSGSIMVSGGTSGAVFDSTTSTITQSFNFLSLPLTTSTTGQIIIGGDPILHNYTPANQNIFCGGLCRKFYYNGSF